MQLIKITLAILFLACICAFGFHEKMRPKSGITINNSQLNLDVNRGVFLYEMKPFTGTAITMSPNGVKAEKANFLEGKRHGELVKFFPDGSESYKAIYNRGLLNDKAYSWWSNGQLRSVSTYKQGTLNGIQQKWYQSGVLFKETNLSNGQELGLQRAWRENGNCNIKLSVFAPCANQALVHYLNLFYVTPD